MNIADLKASLEDLTKAEITPFIWGHAGIGKSEAIKQWALEKGYKFFGFYLGTQADLGDVLGLQEFVRDSNGKAIAVEHAMPSWLRDMIDYCEANPDSGAVIFLDEFNRARKDILSGMFSLALDKTFHTLKLPKNCHLIAAGNPPTDEYMTTDVDETALMARFAHVKLEPTVTEWLNYATQTGVNPDIIAFIRQQPELLDEKRSVFALPVKADRRAIVRLDRLQKTGMPANLLEQWMPGIIGIEKTVAYQQFLKNQERPLTAKEVFSGTNVELLTKWCNPENIQSSFLNLTVDNINKEVVGMNAKTKFKPLNDKQKGNLMNFFEMLPKDIAYPALKTLFTTQPSERFSQKDAVNNVFHDFIKTSDYHDRLLALVKVAKGLPTTVTKEAVGE